MDRLEKEVRITSLALRYRQGERGALGELHAELEPWIRSFLRHQLSGRDSLPPGLEAEDLYQQSYVALAEAALDWEPGRRDSFMPYFLSSFPWRIDRYLRCQRPLRRTAHFQFRSMPHDELVSRAAGIAGSDGREWDEILGCAELAGELSALDGRVVSLHLHHGLSFAEVGEALGISRSAAHRSFARGISRLRALLGVPAASEGGRRGRPRKSPWDEPSGPLRRCIVALHRLASGGASLPGSGALCQAAGLTRREYREIMAGLCALGCVVDRGQGRAGRLACDNISETMGMLEGRWISR